MPTAKMRLDGVHNADDEAAVEDAVRRLGGVYGAVASCRDSCMEVDFEDDEVSVDEIARAARDAGFDATLAG
jgi:copper chaperone CopZ